MLSKTFARQFSIYRARSMMGGETVKKVAHQVNMAAGYVALKGLEAGEKVTHEVEEVIHPHDMPPPATAPGQRVQAAKQATQEMVKDTMTAGKRQIQDSYEEGVGRSSHLPPYSGAKEGDPEDMVQWYLRRQHKT